MKESVKLCFWGMLFLGFALSLVSSGKTTSKKTATELLPLQGNPLVSFRILLRVGSANDPMGKEGLCQLALSMLANGGSKTMTYEEITRKFYPLAASVDLSVDKEMSVFS